MSLPTQNYWVTFTYSTKRKPDKHLYFSFAQFDIEPYFPRVNRFFDFCIDNMKNFNFIDFEIIDYKKFNEEEFNKEIKRKTQRGG